MTNLTFVAPCLFGLEGIAGDELRRMGLENVKVEDRRVLFTGGVEEMAKANMEECEERIRKTEAQMEQIKAASFGYVDNSLRQTEETILKALNEVRDTRSKFQNITKPAAAAETNSQYDQEL